MSVDSEYLERFFKKAINGKGGNLFTRMDALEEAMKTLQVRDVTTYLTQVIQENREIILPSVLGGVSDPTDPAFTGLVISPSGQNIGGVLYSFALIENGIVLSGIGNNGSTVVTNVAPGGVDTNVQYNNAGVFGGDTHFSWNDSTKTLTIEALSSSDQGYIKGVKSSTSDGIKVYGGNTSTINDDGGAAILSGGNGDGTGSGGIATVSGGVGGSDGAGGGVELSGGAGQSTGNGGGTSLRGGQGGATGDGGTVLVQGGAGGITSGDGGGITLEAGSAPTSGNGANIYLSPGIGAGGGIDGFVQINSDVNLSAGHVYMINGVPISISGSGLTHPETMARISIGF